MSYPYITTNNLINPQYYMFSEYHGISFLKEYILIRKKVIKEIKTQQTNIKNQACPLQNIVRDANAGSTLSQGNLEHLLQELNSFEKDDFIVTEKIFQCLKKVIFIDNEQARETIYKWLSGYIKTFEVRKKIFETYDNKFRPQDESWDRISLYADLSLLIGIYYQKYGNLKFLNALLKLNDTLLSLKTYWINEPFASCIAYALEIELDSIKVLCDNKGVDIQ